MNFLFYNFDDFFAPAGFTVDAGIVNISSADIGTQSVATATY